MEELWESLGRENALSAIMGCLVSHQEEEEEKNANDEVHDKKEETGREGSETPINSDQQMEKCCPLIIREDSSSLLPLCLARSPSLCPC